MTSVLYRQYFLKYNYGYYTGALDGISGSGTKAAIKKFQRGYGLSQDGIWGAKTNAKAVSVTKELQTLLNKYGAGLTVDGVLGQKTAGYKDCAEKAGSYRRRHCRNKDMGKAQGIFFRYGFWWQLCAFRKS